jgi:hypothetical protein
MGGDSSFPSPGSKGQGAQPSLEGANGSVFKTASLKFVSALTPTLTAPNVEGIASTKDKFDPGTEYNFEAYGQKNFYAERSL